MNHIKNIRKAILTAFVFALLLPALAFGAVHDLVIYHTNDVHGYMFEVRDGNGKLTNIGYDRLKAVVDADQSPHKLLLDAGDVLHGQSFATSKRGELAAILLSLTGYNALVTGNHDFDYGQERLLELVDKYRLHFLSANVVKKSGGYILPPYIVCSWSDLKVGIFGLATPETRTSTNPRNIEGLEIKDPIEVSRKMVSRLKNEGVDLIIAVMHMGSEEYCKPSSLTIAKETPGIDIIIDGHSHSVLTTQVKRSDGGTTMVASTGSSLQNLGKVMINRKPGGEFIISATTLSASESEEIEAVTPDPAMHSAMMALKTEFDKEMNVVVMKAPFDLDGARERTRSSSTNLGRIICAALVDATGAGIAIMNGGSVRDSIPAGDVTKGDLLSILPYGNYAYTINISGRDLLVALNHGLSESGDGAFPQFWGMEVVVRPEKNGYAVESVTIGGKPLDPKGTYTLAINDFLHSGGDGYTMFTKYDYREFETMEEAFRKFMTEKDIQVLLTISNTEVLKMAR